MRILVVLAAIACAVVTNVTPASAFFKASSGKYPVTISVTSNEVQKIAIEPNLVMECTGLTLTGSLQREGSQLTVAPTYSGCTAKLNGSSFGGVVLKTNGCIYNFHQAKGATTGTLSLECPGSNSIQFEAALGCILKIGKNPNIGTVKYANIGSGTTEEIEVKQALVNMAFTSSGCLGLIPTSGTNLKVEGGFKIKGTMGGTQTGILVA
jgi:hypothetical protein